MTTWYCIWRFQRLTWGTATDKVLSHKSFIIAKDPKYHGYQRDLVSINYRYYLGCWFSWHAVVK